MKYTLPTGRVITIPDDELSKLQNKLKISKEEAIHTYLVDNDYESDEIVEELTKKAKENHITGSIHKAKAENKEKKPRKAREKKIDEVKRTIIAQISQCLVEYFAETGTVEITNPEKYIELSFGDENYTINLVKHRKGKG